MVRAFACVGFLADLFGTASSLFADGEQLGVAGWIATNALLVAIPLAFRIVEPALAALTSAPDVLRFEDGTAEHTSQSSFGMSRTNPYS